MRFGSSDSANTVVGNNVTLAITVLGSTHSLFINNTFSGILVTSTDGKVAQNVNHPLSNSG